MEFQFQSGSRRQSDHLLQPSSLSYVPQPVIQAGYEHNTDRMYSLNPTTSYIEQDPLGEQGHSVESIHHDALQRQLEKQQIRDEIIRSENKRRQMLEAEVRRELMMERQMFGYTAEERPLGGYTSEYRPSGWMDDRFSLVDRVDSSRPSKEPWAMPGSAADKFSFVDRVDGQPSKEPWTYSGPSADRFSFVNRIDYRPSAAEEHWRVSNPAAGIELPSYHHPSQPYSESMALRESLPYTRPEVILAPNDPRMRHEVHLAPQDLMPYMRPEVISAPTSSSQPYTQPYVFSNSAPNVSLPYTKAMQAEINSAANEFILDISNKYASGMKRKAMEPPKRSGSDYYKKKKSDGKWSCTLCDISATSEKTLDDHFKGKKHKEMEEELREKKKVTNKASKSEHHKGKGVGASGPGAGVKKEESLNQTKPQVYGIKRNNAVEKKDGPKSGNLDKPRKYYKFWCKLCQVGADFSVVMEAHNKGKRHFLNVQEKAEAGASSAP